VALSWGRRRTGGGGRGGGWGQRAEADSGGCRGSGVDGRGWTERRTKAAARPGNPEPPFPKTRPLQIRVVTISTSPCNRDDAHADTTEQTYGVNEAQGRSLNDALVHGPTEAQDRSPTCRAVHERHAHDTTPARNKRARAYRRNNIADVFSCWAAGGYLGRASSSTAEGVATPPVVLQPCPVYNSWCAVVPSVCPAGPTSADAVRG
jgi:hypothetical protein